MYIVKKEAKKVLNRSALAGAEAKMTMNLHRDCTKSSFGTKAVEINEMNVTSDMPYGRARTSYLKGIVKLVMSKTRDYFSLIPPFEKANWHYTELKQTCSN